MKINITPKLTKSIHGSHIIHEYWRPKKSPVRRISTVKILIHAKKRPLTLLRWQKIRINSKKGFINRKCLGREQGGTAKNASALELEHLNGLVFNTPLFFKDYQSSIMNLTITRNIVSLASMNQASQNCTTPSYTLSWDTFVTETFTIIVSTNFPLWFILWLSSAPFLPFKSIS